jgi:hypothetical protein
MKTISQTLIMSWLGKNYQWAMVEGSSGLSALGEGVLSLPSFKVII